MGFNYYICKVLTKNIDKMKKAWRLRTAYGYTYVTLFSEDGRILDTYKYHDSMFSKPMPRPFTFMEWNEGLPQAIIQELNTTLKKNNEYTEFIQENQV